MDSKPPPPSLFRRMVDLDTTISLHLHNFTQPILPRSLLKTLEILGDGRLFFPIAISIFLSPLLTTTFTAIFLRSFIADLLVGSVFDLLVIGIIKHLVRRPRPIYNKHMSVVFAVDNWSFPSGHSSRVCFIAAFFCLSSTLIEQHLVHMKSGALQFLFFEEAKVVNYVVSSWAAATSISRVLLGRHFVFDVIAGACLGVFEAMFVFYYLNSSKLASILLLSRRKGSNGYG